MTYQAAIPVGAGHAHRGRVLFMLLAVSLLSACISSAPRQLVPSITLSPAIVSLSEGEAVGAAIDHVFRTCGIDTLTADVDPENAASIRLLERLGFVRTGFAERTWNIGGVCGETIGSPRACCSRAKCSVTRATNSGARSARLS